MSESVREALVDVVRRPDDAIELDRGALLIAKEITASLDVESYLSRIDLMSEHVARRLIGNPKPAQVLAELNHYLFEEEGFVGDTQTYYDPRNSFLNEVLERRTGIPVSLSVLYMELGRRLGLRLEGIGFPGHFLVRFSPGVDALVIDPFHSGKILSKRDCRELLEGLYGSKVLFDAQLLKASSRKRILYRILCNLKAIYHHAGDLHAAVKMVELALCIDPNSAEDIKARGMLYYELECFTQAWTDLERYMDLRPDAEDRHKIWEYLLKAKARVGKVH